MSDLTPEFKLRERIIYALVKRKMREVLGPISQEIKDFIKAEFSDENDRRDAGLIVIYAMEKAATEILADYRGRVAKDQKHL